MLRCCAHYHDAQLLLPFYPRPLFLTWGVLHNHHGPYKDYMMLEAWVLAHTSTIAASFLFRSFRKVCSSRTQSADSPVQSERKTCMQRKAWFSGVVQLLKGLGVNDRRDTLRRTDRSWIFVAWNCIWVWLGVRKLKDTFAWPWEL